jgi:DNA-binding transcriptional LysR family regulator
VRAKMREGSLDWNDLRYFLAIAEEGSTGAAARVLGVDQSTVKRRLSALESAIGIRLIERTPVGYTLTQHGKELLPHATRVEAEVQSLKRKVQVLEPAVSGHVRVACLVTIGHRLLKSGLLDAFHRKHKNIRVELIMGQRVIDLTKGEADIAIRGGGAGKGPLIGKKIADLPWGVYGSRAYVRQHGRPAGAKDLSRFHTVAMIDELEELPAARWLRRNASGAMTRARCGNIPSVHLAIKADAGIGMLPMVHASDDRDLQCLIGPIAELNYPMYLYVHEDLRRVPRIGAFFDFCLRELKPVLTRAARSRAGT